MHTLWMICDLHERKCIVLGSSLIGKSTFKQLCGNKTEYKKDLKNAVLMH